ncbi:MAG: hypothetical protein M3Z22_05915 [Verrucomicrobiota bacterium]|nr:hypothetical protein [Verrucomicrobiota bacterium]
MNKGTVGLVAKVSAVISVLTLFSGAGVQAEPPATASSARHHARKKHHAQAKKETAPQVSQARPVAKATPSPTPAKETWKPTGARQTGSHF